MSVTQENYMLVKPIAKLGNSQCMPLDKTMLSLLEADSNSVLKITFEGRRMIVEAISKEEYEKHALKVADEVMEKHAGLFKRLADHG